MIVIWCFDNSVVYRRCISCRLYGICCLIVLFVSAVGFGYCLFSLLVFLDFGCTLGVIRLSLECLSVFIWCFLLGCGCLLLGCWFTILMLWTVACLLMWFVAYVIWLIAYVWFFVGLVDVLCWFELLLYYLITIHLNYDLWCFKLVWILVFVVLVGVAFICYSLGYLWLVFVVFAVWYLVFMVFAFYVCVFVIVL